MTKNNATLDALAWDKMDGLIPVVVQDADTLQVLMLGYMDRAALTATETTGRVTFFSRSKGRLWVKGETSGHFLSVASIDADCDGDALLVMARPQGPTCHLGTTSCFGSDNAPGVGFVGYLARLIEERARTLPGGSYTTELLTSPVGRVAQKVGEEAVETVIAALGDNTQAFADEAADLVFHLLVLLERRGVRVQTVIDVLRSRHRRTNSSPNRDATKP